MWWPEHVPPPHEQVYRWGTTSETGLTLSDKKTLLVLSENNPNIVLSSNNIKNAKVVTAEDLNTYDLLNADTLLISESAVKKIENTLLNQ